MAIVAAIMTLIVVIAGAISGDGGAGGSVGVGSGGTILSGAGGNSGGYIGSGNNSALFDNSFTKEEFIKMVSSYKVSHVKHGETQQYKDECYKKAFIDYAGDYYDISVSYGFDPRATFCTGIQESDFGTSRIAKDKCNYWGLGAVDGNAYNAAYTYNSIPEGIKALCELWKKYTTPGTWHYNEIVARGGNPTTIEGFNKIYASDQTWANQKINHMKNIFGYVPNTGISSGDTKGTYKSGINGYSFVEYYQNGASWSGDALNGYSGSTVGGAGCHATSMAIALTAVTGTNITPRMVNNAFNFRSCDDTDILNTSAFSSLKSVISISGVKTSGITADWLISQLNARKIIMIRYEGSSEWTSTSHYVICADYKNDGGKDYIYISNPNRDGINGWISVDRIVISTLTQARTISQK